jgi:site-specific DNA recombinase
MMTIVAPLWSVLRDAMRAGIIDQLYVHSPDRLGRKYAYQVFLIEEFSRLGMEVVFLNRELAVARKITCCCKSKA